MFSAARLLMACSVLSSATSFLPSLMRRPRESSIAPALTKSSTADDVAQLYLTANGRDLIGKIAVVTGGNSGIGKETARVLATNGCRVILCSRSLEAGEAAKSEIAAHLDNADLVSVQQLNLADLKDVDKAATSIKHAVAGSGIDYLVLNAGVMAMPSLQRTAQGFEMQVGVNHFGHFRLTDRLRPLVETQGARVVVLSSTAHTMGSVECDDLHYLSGTTGGTGRAYSAWGAYGQSKACNLLFAKSLASRLAPFGGSAFSVHPGVIATNLWREEQGPKFLSRLLSAGPLKRLPKLNDLLPKLIADKSIEQGAATTLFACLCPALPASYQGAYLADCDVGKVGPGCRDAEGALGEKLWRTTEAEISEAL